MHSRLAQSMEVERSPSSERVAQTAGVVAGVPSELVSSHSSAKGKHTGSSLARPVTLSVTVGFSRQEKLSVISLLVKLSQKFWPMNCAVLGTKRVS